MHYGLGYWVLRRIEILVCTYIFGLIWFSCGVGTMEDWDQEMLEKVVETKNKEYNQNKPTDIVCVINYFHPWTCIIVVAFCL